MKTRIAPTPSGFLHLGNGASFVMAWRLAREAGGTVLLRIDDLDAERARSAYTEDIFDMLHWLGLDWDEGPADAAALEDQWTQHRRMPLYSATLEKLRTAGQLYACGCTRRSVQERVGHGGYDGHCRERGLPLDMPGVVWRLRLPANGGVHWSTWPAGRVHHAAMDMPDPVVRQRDGRPSYQIASLTDDVHFGIGLIVRGADLLPSTAVQMHMARALDLDAFRRVRFLHHPLVLDTLGHKLSKSEGAFCLHQARARGDDPRVVHRLAEQLLEQALADPANN